MYLLPPLPKVSPIIKPVSALCNIACDYCYYKNTHNVTAYGRKMTEPVLQRVIADTISIANDCGSAAEFTWHGGEPTLAGLDFYKRAVEIQKLTALGTVVKIDNNIQTNGTLIDDEWAQFCQEERFSFGISLDGPKWLHDSHRFYASGNGSYDKVMQCIAILKDHEIRFGVIAVITDASVGHAREIIDFFVQNDIRQFDLSPCAELPGTPGEKFTISAERYAEFMIEAFDQWLSYDDPSIDIRFLRQAMYGLLGAEPGLCSMSRNFCGVFPTITPNGDVYFCDNYEGSEDLLLGNILQTPLQELIFQPQHRHTALRMEIMAAKDLCKECEWYLSCGGGCPRYNRPGSHQKFGQRNYFCGAYRRILSHISRRLLEIARANEINLPHAHTIPVQSVV